MGCAGVSDSIVHAWSGGFWRSSRKRTLLLTGLPLLILGSVVLPLSLVAPPMVTAISNEQQNIPSSPAAGYYYYASWWVELSANQRAEFQFTATQPVLFVILDKENYDRYVGNQTATVINSSANEWENTHSFTPARAGTYYFMLQNTAGQDATVTVTIRQSFTGLAYIGAAVAALGGILTTLGLVLRPKAVEIPALVLEMVKMHGRIMISELASRFSTSQTDIELALIKLRSKGEPISYLAATGEVWYGSQPRQPETPPTPPPSVDPVSQPSKTSEH